MKKMKPVLIALYRLLIRLYPKPFRDEFGVEMESVFQEQMAEASNPFVLLQICRRELRDWPVHCFQAHWQVRQQRIREHPVQPPTWWETAVSGFPYFLFALFVSGSALIFLFGQTLGLFVSLLLGYGFVFVLLLVLGAAWWRGWPVWSAAWLGFLFFILLVLILPVQLYNLLGQTPQMQQLLIVVTEVALPLVWLAVLYVLLARWPRAGLVAMLPAFGMTWFLYLEFVPEGVKTAVMAGTWIWLGIIAIVLLRWRHHAWDVWLLYLAAAGVGVIYIYTGHFLTEVPVRDGTLARMGEDLLSELLPALIPAVGVLLLHTVRLWGGGNGRIAVGSYRLLLIGLLLTVTGSQIMLRLLLRQGSIGQGAWLIVMSLGGVLLMMSGVRQMIKNRQRERQSSGRLIWLPLILLLFLPLVFDVRWLSVIYNQIKYEQLSTTQFVAQQIETHVVLIRQMSHLIGVVWLFFAGWIIGRFRQQSLPLAAPDDTEVSGEKTAVSPVPGREVRMTRREKNTFFAALLLLVGLLLPSTTLGLLFPNNQSQPFDLPTAFPLFLVMTAGLIMAVVLFALGFRLYQVGGRETAVYFFSLSALLIAAALRHFYWLTIWDSTYDGLGYLWLFVPIMGVFLAAIWLAFKLPHKLKPVAFFYLLLLPPALVMLAGQAQRVDFRRLTEMRAGRVSQALAAYHAQEGHYPEDLHQLTPRYLLTLSEPVIIFGQDWCYEGSRDAYQFGFVDREHWSDPRLFAHRYSESAEKAAALPTLCEQEIIALQTRDPQYYGLRDE